MGTADLSDASALSLRDRRTGRPLCVLITRPSDQAQATADLVQQAGGQALVVPCLVVAAPRPPLSASIEQTLRQVMAASLGPPILAVTSRNAVQALADALYRLQPAQTIEQALLGWQVAAVGPRTAQALADLGRPADLVAGEATSAEPAEDGSSAAQLASRLVIAHATGEPQPDVLFLRAAEARPTLPNALRAAGFRVTEYEAYRMVPAPPEALMPLRDALEQGRVDLVPFGSPRTVAIALSALGSQAVSLLATTRVGAIGQTTAHALREAGIRVDAVGSQASFASLLCALAAM